MPIPAGIKGFFCGYGLYLFRCMVAAFLLMVGSRNLSAQLYTPVSLDRLEQRVQRGGDTLFVINFWATWCAPCIRELPAFEALQDQYKDRGLKVLLVSVDAPTRAAGSLSAFLQKRHLQAEVLHLDEAKPHLYIDRIDPAWSGSIPATLFWSSSTQERRFHEGELEPEKLQSIVQPLIPSP